jgi:hypothetical protein
VTVIKLYSWNSWDDNYFTLSFKFFFGNLLLAFLSGNWYSCMWRHCMAMFIVSSRSGKSLICPLPIAHSSNWCVPSGLSLVLTFWWCKMILMICEDYGYPTASHWAWKVISFSVFPTVNVLPAIGASGWNMTTVVWTADYGVGILWRAWRHHSYCCVVKKSWSFFFIINQSIQASLHIFQLISRTLKLTII